MSGGGVNDLLARAQKGERYHKEKKAIREDLKALAEEMAVCSRKRLQEMPGDLERIAKRVQDLARVGLFINVDVTELTAEITKTGQLREKTLADMEN